MIEILVTMAIVALGLMGVAGLQASAVRYLKTASQRSEATQIAYDISERMRANIVGVRAGNYAYNASYASSAGTMPILPAACKAAKCTPANVAAYDLADLQRSLSSRLNRGGVNIVQNANNWDVVVMWSEAGLTGNDLACNVTGVTNPGHGVRCFRVSVTP